MNEYIRPPIVPIVIMNTSKYSLQSSRRIEMERLELNKRKKKVGQLYNIMVTNLNAIFNGKVTRKHLLPLAKIISEVTNIHIDRMSVRYVDCLICWFIENWTKINENVNDITSAIMMKHLTEQDNSFSFPIDDYQQESTLFSSEVYDEVGIL